MHFSELVSQALEPVANECVDGMELVSTGDFCSKIDRLNRRNKDWVEDKVPVLEGLGMDNVPTGSLESHEDMEKVTSTIPDDVVNKAAQIPHIAGENENNIFVRPVVVEPHIKSDKGGGHGGADKSLGGRVKGGLPTPGAKRMDNKPTRRRGERMREVREKLELGRRKMEHRTIDTEMEIGKRRQPMTWRGERLLKSTETTSEKVQDRGKKMVIVGSDVEALYPSLEDIEVAEICHNAIMNTNVKFTNINYEVGAKYVAMNMTEVEARISPLRRVLPWRTKTGGARPGVTGEGALGPGGKEDKLWTTPDTMPTEVEKRMIVAAVMRIGVIVMMNSHIYTFGGKFFHQKKGGPIGLRATCAVARVTMLDWDRKWMAVLERNNIKLEDQGRYMDDIRAFLHEFKAGWRWWEGGLYWCKQWEVEDREGGRTGLARTTTILEDTMRGVYHFLRMTMENEEDFSDNRLPTLDLNIWVKEDNMVVFVFFEKTMCTNQVLHKDTALAEDTKISSLTAEVRRRMLNTSELLPMEERTRVLDNFSQNMTNSGWSTEKTRDIIIAGLKGYEKMVALDKLPLEGGHKPLHESAAYSSGARARKKLTQKSTWFKDKKREDNKQWGAEDNKEPMVGGKDMEHAPTPPRE